nr:recombination protein NinG [Kosakonia cowanii]
MPAISAQLALIPHCLSTNNSHRQCALCNTHLPENLIAYWPVLIDKIILARFDALIDRMKCRK